jgi:DNA-binding response OmpR family regulator
MTNIIIMDNRPYIRYRVKEVIEKDDIAIHEVANSTQLHNKLKELDYKVSLIILEINLKDEDGIEIIKKLRKRNIDIPFMVLTLVNTREAFIKSVKAGAVDYFLKPFDARDFSRRVISHAMTKEITVIEVNNEANIQNKEVKLDEYIVNKISKAKEINQKISFIMFIVFKSENDLTIDLNKDNELFTNFAYGKIKSFMSEADRFEKYAANAFISVYPSLDEDGIIEKNNKILTAFNENRRKDSSLSGFYFDSVCATFPEDGSTYEEIIEKLTDRINSKINILQRRRKSH